MIRSPDFAMVKLGCDTLGILGSGCHIFKDFSIIELMF